MDAARHAACGEIHAPARARRGADQRRQTRCIESGAREGMCHQAAFPFRIGAVFKVLHSAAAAIGKMAARRRNAVRAGQQNFVERGALRADFRCAHALPRQRARNMHRPVGHAVAGRTQPLYQKLSRHEQ